MSLFILRENDLLCFRKSLYYISSFKLRTGMILFILHYQPENKREREEKYMPLEQCVAFAIQPGSMPLLKSKYFLLGFIQCGSRVRKMSSFNGMNWPSDYFITSLWNPGKWRVLKDFTNSNETLVLSRNLCSKELFCHYLIDCTIIPILLHLSVGVIIEKSQDFLDLFPFFCASSRG